MIVWAMALRLFLSCELNSLIVLSDLGEIPGCLVEHLYLVLCEGVDGEVGVDEHGHPHNHHQVHVQYNLEEIRFLNTSNM